MFFVDGLATLKCTGHRDRRRKRQNGPCPMSGMHAVHDPKRNAIGTGCEMGEMESEGIAKK